MVEILKKIDKKVLILITTMISLPIFIIAFLAIFRSCNNVKLTYSSYEEKMLSGAEKYFKDKDKLPKEESQIETVELSELIAGEYIKPSVDLLKDDSCDGNVSVRLNGSTIDNNEGGFFNYLVNLKCDSYKTKTLNDEIMKSLTTSDSGLYEVNGKYIFKGDKVDNYISFFGESYRIISMDSEGILKLIKTERESTHAYWDNKYNTDVNDILGKNIYKDSEILDQLLTIYDDSKVISKNAKERIVAYNICTDSRSVNDISLGAVECSNVLTNQVISLLDVTDFANASLDPECDSIMSKSCRNYNYLKDLNLITWTYVPVSENTYQAYYLSSGIIRHQNTSVYMSYNIVIFIDGNEIFVDGDGSLKNPYIIK